MGSIDGGAPQLIRESSSRAMYVEPGFLLFVRQGTLLAEEFNWRRQSFSSMPTPVASNVAFSQRLRAAFTASNTGVVVYRSPQPVSQLVWASRDGAIVGTTGEPGEYSNVRLSPDEQSVVLEIHSPDATGLTDGNIWVGNVARGIFTKLTFAVGAHSTTPVWSPDGTSVVFRDSGLGVMRRKSTLAQSEPVTIATPGSQPHPFDWSRDGRTLVYQLTDPKTNADIWMTPVDGSGPAVPFAQSRFDEYEARLSADGRWLAYASNESGRDEIYVRPFPTGPGKWRVTTAGGRGPRWRSDGSQLFFLASDGKLMVVPVRTKNGFQFEAAKSLFDARIREANNEIDFEVTRDGQRFLINERLTVGTSLNVITNWRTALKSEPR